MVIYTLKSMAETIHDDRHASYIRHSLVDLIMISIFAVMADCDEWEEIADFAKEKELWLKKYLELPNGVPSSDTIRVVMGSIDTKHFYSIVVNFLMRTMNEISTLCKTLEECPDIISIGGKESRGSARKGNAQEKKGALHTLNAYSTNYGFCIGQEFIKGKSNEIPAAPLLLERLELSDCIVTWDALNTQKETVKAVIKGHGDYVAALKGNHPLFYKEVVEYFTEEVLCEIKKTGKGYAKTVEQEHGAIMIREYYMTDDVGWYTEKKSWKNLKTFGVFRKTIRRTNGEESTEMRCYLSSLEVDAEMFARAVRNHWGVENNLHGQLDFTFHDDRNTSMEKTSAKNLQTIKKIVLALLRIVQDMYGQSLKRIRKSVARNNEKEIEKIFSVLNVDSVKNVLQKDK